MIAAEQRSFRIRNDVPSSTLARLMLGALNWTVLWYNPRGAWNDAHVSRVLFEVLYQGVAITGN
jgi:hypothetical protein